MNNMSAFLKATFLFVHSKSIAMLRYCSTRTMILRFLDAPIWSWINTLGHIHLFSFWYQRYDFLLPNDDGLLMFFYTVNYCLYFATFSDFLVLKLWWIYFIFDVCLMCFFCIMKMKNIKWNILEYFSHLCQNQLRLGTP